MHKSVSEYRDGYKAHVAVEPETGIITASELTAANAPDGPTGVELLAGEEPGLQVLADSAYGSGETRAKLGAAGHVQAIKPIPLRRPAIEGGFTRDDFTVDHQTRTVTCPQGITVHIAAGGSATFGKRCDGCPLRSRSKPTKPNSPSGWPPSTSDASSTSASTTTAPPGQSPDITPPARVPHRHQQGASTHQGPCHDRMSKRSKLGRESSHRDRTPVVGPPVMRVGLVGPG